MATPAFHIAGRTGSKANVHILRVAGAITHATAPAFREAVGSPGTWSILIVDFSDVPSVDSMAVGALVRAYVYCNNAGRKLVLAGPNHRVINVLRLTGVDALFETYPNVGEAESALS